MVSSKLIFSLWFLKFRFWNPQAKTILRFGRFDWIRGFIYSQMIVIFGRSIGFELFLNIITGRLGWTTLVLIIGARFIWFQIPLIIYGSLILYDHFWTVIWLQFNTESIWYRLYHNNNNNGNSSKNHDTKTPLVVSFSLLASFWCRSYSNDSHYNRILKRFQGQFFSWNHNILLK